MFHPLRVIFANSGPDTELLVANPVELSGNGRPRVFNDVTLALKTLGICIFLRRAPHERRRSYQKQIPRRGEHRKKRNKQKTTNKPPGFEIQPPSPPLAAAPQALPSPHLSQRVAAVKLGSTPSDKLVAKGLDLISALLTQRDRRWISQGRPATNGVTNGGDEGEEVAAATAGPPPLLECKFSQVFGERIAGEEVQECILTDFR
ncbi:hypothetical protein Vadar_020388 [Vaccinium darrowii]|uniref:Uncharacterized protein n=1 Tax=Vaccinium darrowii TaxID=229202 RepID=A0ACB7X2E9_9ERIC|nr:hypothetical protein Vadar_020388 [Vaccinium darrowii]